MTRAAFPSLWTPPGSTLLVDFTDGTHAINTDIFSGGSSGGTATGAARALSSAGLRMYCTAATSGQFVSAYYQPASPMDFTPYDSIWVECYFPDGDATYGGQAKVGLQIYVVQESGATYTNYMNRNHGSNSLHGHLPIMGSFFGDGNWTLTSGGPDGWPAKMASIAKIELRPNAGASAPFAFDCYIRRIWLGKNIKPIVLLSWDDAHAAQYTNAYSVMTDAGLKGTLFPSSSYVGTTDKLTVAQLRTMYEAGWDIGLQQTNDLTDAFVARATDGSGLTRSTTTATWSGTGTHELAQDDTFTISGACDPSWNKQFTVASVSDTTTFTFTCAGTEQTPANGWITIPRVTEAAAKANIAAEQAYWSALGMTRGINFMAYAAGLVNPVYAGYMNDIGILLARTSSTTPAPQSSTFDGRTSHYLGRLMLPSQTMDNATGATVLGYVATARSMCACLALRGHNQAASGDSNTMATAEFDILIDGDSTHKGLAQMHKEGQIEVLTFSQLWNSMTGKTKRPAS